MMPKSFQSFKLLYDILHLSSSAEKKVQFKIREEQKAQRSGPGDGDEDDTNTDHGLIAFAK